MDREKEINSMELETFRGLFSAARKQKEFVRLFNWGIESLDDAEKDCLREVFEEHGVVAPIADDELEMICAVISGRCVKLN